jgi:hypothetical protein
VLDLLVLDGQKQRIIDKSFEECHKIRAAHRFHNLKDKHLASKQVKTM